MDIIYAMLISNLQKDKRYTYYVLDVLWGQPIKLIEVVSTLELHEYWWDNIVLIFFCPLRFLQGLRSKNIK